MYFLVIRINQLKNSRDILEKGNSIKHIIYIFVR